MRAANIAISSDSPHGCWRHSGAKMTRGSYIRDITLNIELTGLGFNLV